jgi:putative DNA primase/helicase
VTPSQMRAIPAELRERQQWVVYRLEERDGKTTKVPYRATDPNRPASSTDPASWSTFADAVACSAADGVGFVFTEDDPYVGVDLDHVYVDGELHPAADAIVRLLDSYTERSVSGTGVHIIVRGELRGGRNRTKKTPWGHDFETYDRGRYFCMTAEVGSRHEIRERQAELDAVCAEIFPPAGKFEPRRRVIGTLELEDREILERAFAAKNGSKFEQLWRGDIDKDTEHSEADLSLLNLLAFWTGRDPDRMDRLFRQSGLNRPKWEDRADYREMSINRAIENCSDVYSPQAPRPLKSAGGETSIGAAPFAEKFTPKKLADTLVAETPVATDAAGNLFAYRSGVYVPGEDDLRDRITRHLAHDWRRNRRDDVLGFLRDSAPKLMVEPPIDRINTLTGIVDLNGNVEPHTPDFLSPIQVPVNFDPGAECPAIDRFLSEVLAADLAEQFREWAGYLTVPDNSLQAALMALGAGANGKSTALNVLGALIGERNFSAVALHRLEDDRFAVAELEGMLANIFGDLDARALNASSIFKSITGGDMITGERKFKDAYQFKAYARLLFSANEPPPTPDSSAAFFRRWQILPFERRFDPSKADRHLTAKLTTPDELAGLFVVGLARLDDLRRRGEFLASDAGAAAKERFKIDADTVSGFLDDACEVGDGRVPKATLYRAYQEWCRESGRPPKGKQKFNRQIAEKFAEVKSHGTTCWDGLLLENGIAL